MALNVSESLSTLINAGADSFTNLFRVTCSVADSLGDTVASSFSARVNNVIIPEVALKTVQLPYMNGVYEKSVASSSINRISSFNLRIDENFAFYNSLLQYAPITLTGNLKTSNIIDEIKIEALDPSGSQFKTVKTWTFKDCEIISIGSFTYNYDSSNPVSVVVKFTWGNI